MPIDPNELLNRLPGYVLQYNQQTNMDKYRQEFLAETIRANKSREEISAQNKSLSDAISSLKLQYMGYQMEDVSRGRDENIILEKTGENIIEGDIQPYIDAKISASKENKPFFGTRSLVENTPEVYKGTYLPALKAAKTSVKELSSGIKDIDSINGIMIALTQLNKQEEVLNSLQDYRKKLQASTLGLGTAPSSIKKSYGFDYKEMKTQEEELNALIEAIKVTKIKYGAKSRLNIPLFIDKE